MESHNIFSKTMFCPVISRCSSMYGIEEVVTQSYVVSYSWDNFPCEARQTLSEAVREAMSPLPATGAGELSCAGREGEQGPLSEPWAPWEAPAGPSQHENTRRDLPT